MIPENVRKDPFTDDQGRAKILKGAALYSNAPRIAEMYGMLGYDLAWIELEHGQSSYSDVEMLCMAAENGGAIPSIRVQSSQRQHILRALEVGAVVVFVPMVETVEQARDIVRFGKFKPLGERGVHMRTRGHSYGMGGFKGMLAANERTHLFAQIETPEGVDNIDEILAVEGLSGIFIGPYDLSVAMGIPGQFKDEAFRQTIDACIRKSRQAGKHVGIMSPPPLLEMAIEAGADLLMVHSDLAMIESEVKNNLKAVNAVLAKSDPSKS